LGIWKCAGGEERIFLDGESVLDMTLSDFEVVVDES
jgi:hypothetical protein